jgi:hypothetical protein
MDGCVNGKTLEEFEFMKHGESLAFAKRTGPSILVYACIGVFAAWCGGFILAKGIPSFVARVWTWLHS